MPQILYDNFVFLVGLTKNTQKHILHNLNMSEGAPWQWKRRNAASPSTLKKLASYFSKECDLPYELFKDGQALLFENFESIYEKHKKDLTLSQSNNILRKDELKPWEKDFVIRLRQVVNDSDVIPLSEHYITLALKCHKAMGRDEKLMQSFIDVIDALSRK